MLSELMLKGGLAGNVIPRQTLEVSERDKGGAIGEDTGITRIQMGENSVKLRKPRVTTRSVSAAVRRETQLIRQLT